MQSYESELAEQYALQTRRSFFLTGKAGTGKTTLLRNITAKTSKNFVVVAPTGVAAINAGGTTIHSMFHFPMTCFVPTGDAVDMNLATNRRRLLDHMKYKKERMHLFQEMELLIIDEISMVRCDILDAIDFTLRTTRKNQEPFGGVQVMLIGDMHQLPPVVKEPEWQILRKYYDGPYFFDSHVWKSMDAMHIELMQVYRQSDKKFVNLLNNIRHQDMQEDDFEALKERFKPDFNPTEEGYVLLSTHNKKAESVNERELRNLMGRSYLYEAKIEGEFPDNMFPCDKVLQLKEGAQVMFIRNDAEGGRYFNGKLAVVSRLDNESITVNFHGSQEEFTLHREIWENINYSVEPGSENIKTNELGTFSQYPLRLAWAITIHKSQGLTFDKVIIDAGNSFAAGQVYVALSRCRSLEGIVLHSLITNRVLYGDERINDFSDTAHGLPELENTLKDAKAEYANYLLKRLFTFNKLSERINDWNELLQEKDLPAKDDAVALYQNIAAQIRTIHSTAEKFQPQLSRLLSDYDRGQSVDVLKERCTKGIEYFTDSIFNQLITPLHQHITDLAYKSGVKKYIRHLQALESNFWNKINQMYAAKFLDEQLYNGPKHVRTELKELETSVTTTKKEKGGTYKDTLALYKQGKTPEEIAEIRTLAIGTIKGHFARLIGSGDVDIYAIVPADRVRRLEKLLQDNPAPSPNLIPEAVKAQVGNGFDYDDIRMVMGYMRKQRSAI